MWNALFPRRKQMKVCSYPHSTSCFSQHATMVLASLFLTVIPRRRKGLAKLFHKSSFKSSVLRFSFQKVSLKTNSNGHTCSTARIFSMVLISQTTLFLVEKLKRKKKKSVTDRFFLAFVSSKDWKNHNFSCYTDGFLYRIVVELCGHSLAILSYDSWARC